MKRTLKLYLKLYLLIIFPVLLISTSAFAQGSEQFKWLHPLPQGSSVMNVQSINAQTWYGVTNAGSFIKTNDGGANWTELKGRFIHVEYGSVHSLGDLHFSNINTGWVCGSGGTLAKTTDAGNTWTDTPIPGVTSGWVDMYFINDNTGFVVGRYPHSIAKTSDGGMTWSPVDSLPSYVVSIFAFNETKLIYASSQGRIYTSNNGGVSWSSMQVGGNTTYYKVNFVNDTLGMISGYQSVYLTTDGGANWISRGSGLPAGAYWHDIDFFIKGDSVEAYITGDEENIYKDVINSGAGVSWEAVDFKESTSQYQNTMFSTDVLGEDSLITAGAYGIFNKRYTSGDTRAFLNRLGVFTLYDIWASGDGNTIIAPGSGGHILYSTDAGDNWDTTYIGNNHDLAGGISMVDDNTGWTCGEDGAVYRTTDGGLNWDFRANAGSSVLWNCSFVNSNIGWVVGSDNTIQITTDAGLSWTMQTSPGVGTAIYDIHMVDTSTGFLVGDGGRINKTTDAGSTWLDLSLAPDRAFYGVFMHDVSTGWVCGERGILKTTNGGATWDSLAVPFSNITAFRLYFTDEWNGMAVCPGGLTLRTRDGGATWEYNTISEFSPQGIYMTSSGIGYISGLFGNVFKYEELLTGNTYTGSEIPGDYILEQNYPNPFNPSTTIKFALPQVSAVSLKVYDIAGREVASLFNNEMLNAGTFEQRFDGSNLSSGVYFYSLVVDNQLVSTKKMLLIK